MSWGEADVFFHRVKKDPGLKACCGEMRTVLDKM